MPAPRIRSLLLVAVVLASRASQASPAEGAWHFVTESFPPYTLEQSGRAAGPMVDVLQKVCERLRVHCAIEVLPWRRALRAAERGEVDGVFTVVDTPERRAMFYLADPVVEARYVFYAQAGDGFSFTAPRDLQRRTIGVYGPSASSLTLAGLMRGTSAEMAVEVDNPTVLRKLGAGRYGAGGLAMVNEMVAEDIIARDHLTGLHPAGEASRFAYTFGLSRLRFDPREVARFNEALGALCRSGGLQSLLDRYRMRAPACRR